MLSGAAYCENRDSELHHMESSENITPVDPCSRTLMGEDGGSIVEECGEDDDSDDDYASIQRPAFLVDGEPNFDSGPPEDGWEYLRRVRYYLNCQNLWMFAFSMLLEVRAALYLVYCFLEQVGGRSNSKSEGCKT